MAKKISDYSPAAALDGTELMEFVQAGANKKGPNGAILPPGYIDGLQMQWVSSSAITFTSGSAYIPSLGRVLRVAADIAKTGISTAASTMYHAYLWLNGAAADVEISTTAPSATYSGNARTKTGDTSRRYLGSFYTNAASAGISRFDHDATAGYIQYTDQTRERLRVLSGGTATTSANASLSGIVPSTSTRAYSRIINTNPSGGPVCFVSNPDLGPAGNVAAGNYLVSIASLFETYMYLSLSNAQQVNYCFSSGSTGGGLYLDVQGYQFKR